MKTGKHNKEYLKMWKILMIHVINGISHGEAYLKAKKEVNYPPTLNRWDGL